MILLLVVLALANSRDTYSKGGAVWDANGQIRNDGEQPVGEWTLEGEVVRDFVDGEEQVLVGGRAKDVGNGPELEREEGRIAEVVCESDLEADDAGDDVLGQGLMATELGDLGLSVFNCRAGGQKICYTSG